VKPREYFNRQCVIACEGDEADIGNVVQLIGDDSLAFFYRLSAQRFGFPRSDAGIFPSRDAGSEQKKDSLG
jgi:hypothetical protein